MLGSYNIEALVNRAGELADADGQVCPDRLRQELTLPPAVADLVAGLYRSRFDAQAESKQTSAC